MKTWLSARSVITGAGSGLGRDLALALAGRGGHLVLSDINLPAVQQTAARALAAGARSAKALACDVQKIADVEALAAACDGPVDLVVNNAGVASSGLVGELPLDSWRWTIEVDLFGVIHGCHVFVPLLKKQGHGQVLNVASAAGLLSAPRLGAYNVAKAGVVALSETLQAELIGTGVGVTVLCPTFFQTNIMASSRYTDEVTRQIGERIMAKAPSSAAVVAAALAAVERNELYCVPMADGRWMWRLKRASPDLFGRVLGVYTRLDARRRAKMQTQGNSAAATGDRKVP